MISQEIIQSFMRHGVVVIPEVISADELTLARESFHESLRRKGVDPDSLSSTAQNIPTLSSTGGAGGILDIFYEDWKLKLNEHPKVVAAMCTLWAATFATCEGVYTHPFGRFDPNVAYMYIDRVCYRVPETISNKFRIGKKSLQRSLTPHLDCCPHRLYESGKENPKWRPIQAFLSLTDSLNENEGGFEACLGLHQRFDDWVSNRMMSGQAVAGDANTAVISSESHPLSDTELMAKRPPLPPPPPPCVGDFTPIRPREDQDIISQFQHVPCRAGDLVCWDFRTPHANARRNDAEIAREVVYIGLLPDVPINRSYTQHQLQRYRAGLVPVDQWCSHQSLQPNDYAFSDLGRRLMGMDPW